MNKIIKNFIAKLVAGRADDGIMITLKDPKKVDFQTAMMEDLLMRNGINPNAITSEAQLKSILNQIKAAEAQSTTTSGIRNTESAKVFDMEGKEIPPGSKIMGGEAVETEAEIAARLEKGNKDSVQKILERKNREDVYGIEDYDTTNMSDIQQEIIRTETQLGNLNPNLPDFRERAKPLVDKITALQKKLREDKANGGRIGLKGGTFLKFLKKFKTKQSGDDLKDFLSKRKFLKDIVGNTEKNKRARELTMLKEAMDEAKKNPGFEFPSGKELRKEIEKKIGPILLKDRKLNADGGRIGFFMGSKFPKGLATLRDMVKFFSKGKEKERSGSEILKLVNPKQFNKLLEDPRIYDKFDVQKGIGAPELIKNMQDDMTKNRTMMIEEILSAAKNIRKSDLGTMERKNEIIEEMIKKGIDRDTAEEMADTMVRMAEATVGMRLTPKLTDEGILELENILKNMETGGKDKRSLNADGGRIGLKDGMNRRTFLKLLGGFASIPIIGKIIKPLKTVKGVKNVPIIKTDAIPGKPEWFDQLINKVIIEGDDVTKKLATVEREVVHTKKINDTDEVTVYQDLNTDSVRVEYNSPNNMLEESVDLSYKKTPPDEGAPKGSAEFEATESGFVSRADGPDDYFIDAESVGGSSIKSLDSDVSALKQYATGQKQTLKEFVESKKRKDKVKKLNEGDLDAQNEYIVNRQGDYVDYGDFDYASGGIARMLGE